MRAIILARPIGDVVFNQDSNPDLRHANDIIKNYKSIASDFYKGNTSEKDQVENFVLNVAIVFAMCVLKNPHAHGAFEGVRYNNKESDHFHKIFRLVPFTNCAVKNKDVSLLTDLNAFNLIDLESTMGDDKRAALQLSNDKISENESRLGSRFGMAKTKARREIDKIITKWEGNNRPLLREEHKQNPSPAERKLDEDEQSPQQPRTLGTNMVSSKGHPVTPLRPGRKHDGKGV
jgi:hypothetical protein